jgi:hypothetical protein
MIVPVELDHGVDNEDRFTQTKKTQSKSAAMSSYDDAFIATKLWKDTIELRLKN